MSFVLSILGGIVLTGVVIVGVTVGVVIIAGICLNAWADFLIGK